MRQQFRRRTSRSAKKMRNKRRRTLVLESLEDRRLLATLSPGDLPSGLASWWDGDLITTTVSDRVGRNDGYTLNETNISQGMVGRAFDFDGTNDYVQFGNVLAFDREDPFSFDFWIQQEPTVTGASITDSP